MPFSKTAMDTTLGNILNDFPSTITFSGTDYTGQVTMLDRASRVVAGLAISRKFILQLSDFTTPPAEGDVLTHDSTNYLCLGADRCPDELQLRLDMYLIPTSFTFSPVTGSISKAGDDVFGTPEAVRGRIDVEDERGDILGGQFIQTRTFIIEKPTVAPTLKSKLVHGSETIIIRNVAEIRSDSGNLAGWRLTA